MGPSRSQQGEKEKHKGEDHRKEDFRNATKPGSEEHKNREQASAYKRPKHQRVPVPCFHLTRYKECQLPGSDGNDKGSQEYGREFDPGKKVLGSDHCVVSIN